MRPAARSCVAWRSLSVNFVELFAEHAGFKSHKQLSGAPKCRARLHRAKADRIKWALAPEGSVLTAHKRNWLPLPAPIKLSLCIFTRRPPARAQTGLNPFCASRWRPRSPTWWSPLWPGCAPTRWLCLSESGHNASDFLALLLSFVAVYFQSRPADDSKTFGYQRAGVLAAFINAATLIVISIWIGIEAIHRLSAPVAVQPRLMMIVAAAGVVMNGVIAALLVASGPRCEPALGLPAHGRRHAFDGRRHRRRRGHSAHRPQLDRPGALARHRRADPLDQPRHRSREPQHSPGRHAARRLAHLRFARAWKRSRASSTSTTCTSGASARTPAPWPATSPSPTFRPLRAPASWSSYTAHRIRSVGRHRRHQGRGKRCVDDRALRCSAGSRDRLDHSRGVCQTEVGRSRHSRHRCRHRISAGGSIGRECRRGGHSARIGRGRCRSAAAREGAAGARRWSRERHHYPTSRRRRFAWRGSFRTVRARLSWLGHYRLSRLRFWRDAMPGKQADHRPGSFSSRKRHP